MIYKFINLQLFIVIIVGTYHCILSQRSYKFLIFSYFSRSQSTTYCVISDYNLQFQLLSTGVEGDVKKQYELKNLMLQFWTKKNIWYQQWYIIKLMITSREIVPTTRYIYTYTRTIIVCKQCRMKNLICSLSIQVKNLPVLEFITFL